MNTPLTCRDDGRRDLVRKAGDPSARPRLNGVDYVEYAVGTFGADPQAPVVTIYLLNKAPTTLSAANVRVEGGRAAVHAVQVAPRPGSGPDRADAIAVLLDKEGDFAPYTLRLVEQDGHGRPGERPLQGFDPRYASATFSFKTACPSDLDCAAVEPCPPAAVEEPEIDYLNKDYAGFRQLMLDRLALTLPAWQETSPADPGVMLVELMAYVGDHLSYYQDAVATEAYLGTARQRVSVRRHARLVDYALHEGCNARAWVCVNVGGDVPLLNVDLSGLQVYAGSVAPAATEPAVIFEPIGARRVNLYPRHNEIHFYPWGDSQCCLPKGATSATLWSGPVRPPDPKPAPQAQPPTGDEGKGAETFRHHTGHPAPHRQHHEPPYPPHHPHHHEPPPLPPDRLLQLQPGDVLIFEEVIGPVTGDPDDADPARRHAVRLTKVRHGEDPLYLSAPERRPVCDVEWAIEDKLPFPFCVSTLVYDPPDNAPKSARKCRRVEDVSVARGNVLLVDHGATVVEPEPGAEARFTVPAPAGTFRCAGVGDPRPLKPPPPVFRPGLKYQGLTHRTVFPAGGDVARRQSRALNGLLSAVREFVPDLIARLKVTREPLTDDERGRIVSVFGPGVLEAHGLHAHDEPAPKYERWRSRCDRVEDQIDALQSLLAKQERLLRPKARRVAVLVEHLRAGYLLTAAEAREVGETFGAGFAPVLDPGAPSWSGPAQLALVQDPRGASPVISAMQVLPDDDGAAPEFCTPPPSWSVLAGEQQGKLINLKADALNVVCELIHRIEGTPTPLTPSELERLRTLFGDKALKDVGLPGAGHMRAAHQLRDLKKLEAKQEELLRPKFQRLQVLRDYLDNGDVLTEDEVFEVVAMFGPDLVPGLVGPLDREQALWCPKPDLLASGGNDRDFVVETDDTDRGQLRFGDGVLGAAPPPGQRFRVAYRVGNGVAGNVGADAIHALLANPYREPAPPAEMTAVRNPLAASGGVEPESADEAKLFAPGAFRKDQLRAITADDFARLAALHPGVRLAASRRRWTGSGVEITVAVAPFDTDDVSADLIAEVEADLVRYRRIGYDVRVVPAEFVGIVLGLTVDVLPHYQRGHVEAALLDVFSNRINRDGRPGLFYPNNWGFGQSVELSRLIAAARGVAGVEDVSVTDFHRFGVIDMDDPEAGPGVLTLSPLEIARLDQDINAPERGGLTPILRGGR